MAWRGGAQKRPEPGDLLDGRLDAIEMETGTSGPASLSDNATPTNETTATPVQGGWQSPVDGRDWS
jgi:hypothetical protein